MDLRRSSVAVRLIGGVVMSAVFLVACSSTPSGGGEFGSSLPSKQSHEADFPPSTYPSPDSFPDWGPSYGCPSDSGVEKARHPSISRVLSIASRFGHVSEHRDKRMSDRAFWPFVESDWRKKKSSPPEHISKRRARLRRVSYSPLAGAVGNYCPHKLLARSWELVICIAGRPSCRQSPSLAGQWGFLRRDGNWLVWFVN